MKSFCALIGLIVWTFTSLPVLGGEDIGAHRANAAVESGETLLLDVRSPAEWRKTGVPKGALALSIHQEGGSRAFYEAVLDAVNGDRTRRVALICAAGVRSHRAMRILEAGGFENVENVA